MLPDPLHPALVHFPIVLAMLLPILAAGTLVAIRKGAAIRRAWALPVFLSAALFASAFAATRSGEAEEDRVERVVGERPLHAHEEAAEQFLLLSGFLLVITAAGLAGGTLGRAGRILATLGAAGLVAAAIQVGHSGGELVYTHGAGNAYSGPTAEPTTGGGGD
jgi:uncharacterized membrane protein